MARRLVTVNDLLDGQVGLDIECPDRVYLNGYVPNLQVAGQLGLFLTGHLGNPIPSPDSNGRSCSRARHTETRCGRGHGGSTQGAAHPHGGQDCGRVAISL
jgi:hypothetical protein